MDSKDSDSSKTVSSAFLRQGSFNVIVVDWSAYSGFPYLSALSNLPGASRAVADALNRMVQTGLPAESIWLTGHSLGAQLIGVASDTITFQIHQITGMDPAGPGFETPGVARLTRDAAELVEIVHTDAGVFGFNAPCGDVDIWPNGGTAVQPGCFLELEIGCSHLRSWMYFAEAVNHADAFPAVRCASWDDFRRGACPANGGDVVYMAHSHPGQNQTGNFYLTTNRASPFGKGQQGVTINA
ncbi:pancreatic triacylglycerol lipase-like isoform X2 [Frankliniella occidentalis]|nr:pancreatic triacylglycerol lipase-like isoform X2 [Frankliniella occidentalis]